MTIYGPKLGLVVPWSHLMQKYLRGPSIVTTITGNSCDWAPGPLEASGFEPTLCRLDLKFKPFTPYVFENFRSHQ